MEARIYENQIVLPIGTAITFKMIAKNHQKINLKVIESDENSKFLVLFDENDVDFEIDINNAKCIHGIGYTLIVNNGFYDYYVGAGEQWSMEALYTRGRKLHFISQNSEDGQNVIKQTAEQFDITYSESAAICSRIEFNFEVEKVEPKPKPRLKGQTMELASESLGASILPSFGSLSSNSRFKSSGIDVPDSTLFADNQLRSLSAERDESQTKHRSKRIVSAPVSTQMFGAAVSTSNMPRVASLATKWNPNQDQNQENNIKPQIGDKGVVCFGEQSNQFYNEYNGFTKDKNLEIKSFVVELRFSKKAE